MAFPSEAKKFHRRTGSVITCEFNGSNGRPYYLTTRLSRVAKRGGRYGVFLPSRFIPLDEIISASSNGKPFYRK